MAARSAFTGTARSAAAVGVGARTSAAKSGSSALTQIGLALKTVIDQMREQVQNVE